MQIVELVARYEAAFLRQDADRLDYLAKEIEDTAPASIDDVIALARYIDHLEKEGWVVPDRLHTQLRTEVLRLASKDGTIRDRV